MPMPNRSSRAYTSLFPSLSFIPPIFQAFCAPPPPPHSLLAQNWHGRQNCVRRMEWPGKTQSSADKGRGGVDGRIGGAKKRAIDKQHRLMKKKTGYQMQQPTSQASSNAVMGQFSQSNISSGYAPHPTPAFLQSTTNFDNTSAVDSFAQYHQIHLYPPLGGMPPAELQQLNGTTMQPIGQQRVSPQPPIGQFQANEIMQKAQNGMTGPGRPPKQRDKSDGNVKEDGQMENGRKMDMERGQPPPTENGGHHEGDTSTNNLAKANPPGGMNVPSSSICAPPIPQNHFIYGSNGGNGFGGPFDGMGPSEYSTTLCGWNGILPTSYPQIGPHQVSGPMPGGPCIGHEEMGSANLGIYAPNGLMNGLHGQLPYELEPMGMGTAGYGVWPTGAGTGGYYMGNEHQHAKLLVDGQYLSPNGGNGQPDQFSEVAAFYGSLQAIPSSIDASAFPSAISTLPPPPSQLASSDQLFGIQHGFTSICPPQMEAANSLNGLTQIGGQPPNPNGHSNPSSAVLYPHPPPQQSAELFGDGGATITQLGGQNGVNNGGTKFGNANADVPTPQHCNVHPGPSNQHSARLAKKSSAVKANLRGATALGRPTTSAGQNLTERSGGTSLPKRKSRSRSVVKSEDDENMTEEREAERRNANNTRERIRVRDINSAFKELARLCSQHMPNVEERSLTKLGTLLKAVELIPLLERKVEEKNRTMGTRRECLKQRLEAAGPSPLSAAAFPIPSQMIHQGPMNAASISPFLPLAAASHPSAILGIDPGPSDVMHHQQPTQAAGGGRGHFN